MLLLSFCRCNSIHKPDEQASYDGIVKTPHTNSRADMYMTVEELPEIGKLKKGMSPDEVALIFKGFKWKREHEGSPVGLSCEYALRCLSSDFKKKHNDDYEYFSISIRFELKLPSAYKNHIDSIPPILPLENGYIYTKDDSINSEWFVDLFCCYYNKSTADMEDPSKFEFIIDSTRDTKK